MFEGNPRNSALDRSWGGGNTAERWKFLMRPDMSRLPNVHTSYLFTARTKPSDMCLGSMQRRKQYGMKGSDAQKL